MPEEKPGQQTAQRERPESPPGQGEGDDRDRRRHDRGSAERREPAKSRQAGGNPEAGDDAEQVPVEQSFHGEPV